MATVSNCGDDASTARQSNIAPCAADRSHFRDTSKSPCSKSSPSGQLHPDLQCIIDWIKLSPPEIIPDWTEFALEPEQYKELQELESDWSLFGRTLKYDYSHANQTISFRMPISAGHEVLVSKLKDRIRDRLANHDDNMTSSTKEFAQNICDRRGSANVTYWTTEGKKITRQPDAQFTFKGRKYPSLVCEIAWSQTSKSLKERAEEYIRCTEGAIRTVVGIDVDYGQWKSAAVTVWRAAVNKARELVDTTSETTIIRDAGVDNSDPDAGLRLSLKDFAFCGEVEVCAGLDLVPVFISLGELCAMVKEAEEEDRVWQTQKNKNVG